MTFASDLVKRICTSYVQHYYNPKYERVGSLFQSRYNSRAVEDEEDVMNVCRYILQNAMKQGETKRSVCVLKLRRKLIGD